ncbi:uncharacterized protein LOC124328244 isoform X1 [Daphnia pulicaria]|uniref:uncharacterized protein LOC124328244 isoform X1 n=1 Tax=Daphnia pulicaria TaxID=35523 RepID=UPI001EE9C950|nr:uncharacterized protein LOC124328244 isoform X1 [Daphnia pulicaria]
MSSSTCSTSRLIRFQLLLLSLPIVIFLVCQQGDAARTASDRQTTGQHWAANNNNNNNNNLKRHGRRQHNSRPCFICPGSSMLISPDRYDDADVAYNGVDAQQHDGAVRMPEPVVRPCLYSNKYQKGKMRTQVVLGPQPGTVLDQGTHRVVVKVAYQLDSDNNITDRSLAPRHHAYCRYTLQVMPSSLAAAEEESREPVRLCRPPPSPEHGRVACSSVGDDVSITTCRYTCDEGYVTPKTDRHLVHQDWDCYSDPGTSRPPKCIKFESPVPLDPSQCSGLNLTVPDFDPVQLPLPKFQTPAVNSAVYVTCDLNVIQAATNGSSISPTVFKRLCVAKNNETDAKFNCNYDIQIHLDPTSGRTVMFAEFRFQLGRLLPTSSYPTSWCDDRAVVERIMETAKTGLLQSNAEPCQTANCSLLTAQCHREISNNKSSGAVLNLAWTVAASYQPFSYDDYFYEGSEVPEGEMLIEKIKAETEVLIQTNLDFRKKLETAGGDLLDKTFQLAKLDLICPLPGYVVNASTNNCQKCPPNTFQQKSVCQLCPERTYQDRAGQTECRPCPNRPSVTVKSSEHYNSRCRPSRPDHASIVALTKLPNRKSSSSTIQTRQLSSSASGKLGKIAAAHSQTSPNHNDKFTSSSKYKNRRHHQHPVSHQQPYQQLATGRSAVSRNSFTSPAINDTAGIVDDDEDPCSPNPCLAGGTCFRSTRYADNNRIVSSFKCSCRVGTKGIHCETPYCPTLYCLNGGTCHVNRQVKGNLGRDLLNCTCPLGFTGSRCEHRRQSNNNNHVKIRHNRHHSLHHQPNGSVNFNGDVTRANKTIGASSRGAAGLMGTYCASNPCKNGGRCVDNSHAAPGYFTCFCPPNFQGELCDFTPCPTSIARTSCPMSFHYPLTSAGRSRKRHSCWIQTSTGRRQCYWPPHPPSPASKSSSPAAPLYEIA